jgi:hypothetical protein
MTRTKSRIRSKKEERSERYSGTGGLKGTKKASKYVGKRYG